MKFHILTLFPEMVMNGLNTSILGRAMAQGLIEAEAVNIRSYTSNRHGKVDDYIYGGGAGLLMQAQPVYDAWKAVESRIQKEREEKETETALSSASGNSEDREETEEKKAFRRTRVVYLTPTGRVFNQSMAEEFSKEEDLILLCGHYEGIDERVIEEIVTDPVSIGDFVLTGGELPAMMIVDAVSRLVPGVLGNEVSAETDSFQNGLLEYPQYSRPEEWMGKKVPEILLSGDHAKVDAWRLEQSLARTKAARPDLYEAWKAAHPDPPPKKRRRRKPAETLEKQKTEVKQSGTEAGDEKDAES